MSASPINALSAVEAKGVSWLKQHERIVLVTLVLIAGSVFGDHWLNVRAVHDQQVAAISQQQLADAKSKDAELAVQLAQITSQYQTLQSEVASQNAALLAAEESRAFALQQQTTADKTMPLPDLGNRWASLIGAGPGDLSASPNGITVSSGAAHNTVAQLEQVPVLTQNLRDETTVADSRQQELDKANTLIADQTTQITNLNTTVKLDDKACTDKLAAQKAVADKAKSKWFKVGFFTGWVTGFITGHRL